MKRILILVLTFAVGLPAYALRQDNPPDQGKDQATTKSSEEKSTAKTSEETNEGHQSVEDRLNKSAKILDELISAPDAGIPEKVLKSAQCVMVVPSMVKGGFIFGGRHGRGVVTCRQENGRWSAPTFVALDGGSWGAQIGVASVDLVLLFMNKDGVRHLLSDNFKLGGEASVAAGPVGRQASGDTDVKLNSEILSYSRTKGLFAGLELTGAAVRPDKDSIKAFYGRDVNFRTALTGNIPPPPEASTFLSAVRKNFREARAQG